MVSQKPFISQEICHIDLNGERSICNVYAYIKSLSRIVEIENKICQRFFKLNTPVEYRMIMSLEGIPASNSPRQIDHQKCTILANDTVVLDVILQNYSKESLLEDAICEDC